MDTSSEYSYGGQQEVKYSMSRSYQYQEQQQQSPFPDWSQAYQSPYQEQSPFGQPDWSQAYQAPPPVVPPVSQHQDSWHQPEFSHVTSTTLGGMHHHPAFLQVRDQ